MGFTETTFLFIFLPITIISAIIINRFAKQKLNIMLLLFSILFYGWGSWHTLIELLFVTLLIYLTGNLIYSASNSEKASKQETKRWLALSIAILLIMLIYFKYAAFLLKCFNVQNNTMIHVEEIIVPLGLSFVVFEAISYLVDIYRGEAVPSSLLETALFIFFFPKLISGPIVQYKDFQPQIKDRVINADKIYSGLCRIAIGYAKKAIIADTFAVSVVSINAALAAGGVDTQTVWLLAVLYFFELYYDFSGYSDIAIGLAEVLGFSFKENFNYPYRSLSISEFWRRWHISLGSWFREYVYIPLGGSRRGNVYINLMVVFLLTGLWHGANWTFIVWGALNGLCVVIERFIRKYRWYNAIPSIIKWAVTVVLILLGWVIFMSPDLNEAGTILRLMFFKEVPHTYNFTWRYYLTNRVMLLLVVAAAGSFCDGLLKNGRIQSIGNKPAVSLLLKIAVLCLFILDIMFVVNSNYSPFIYFQF